ncbi:MAG: LuxR C-terminal-related transcriptional regulator [Dehalococcoidia bacterium]|nr:hypothetical protein [Dehalococcoidia bacterium]MCB9485763.1 hypothetical protein [Thermoflexaceae bacterium]
MESPPIQYAVTSDGLRIAYRRYAGASPPFLIVHSPGAMPFSVSEAIPALAQEGVDRFARGRSVVFFEWRCTGNSDSQPGPLSAEDLIADLEAIADAAGEPVDGRFMARGCLAGCLHAARHPHRYRSIEIVNGAVNIDDTWLGIVNRDGWQANYVEHLLGLLRHYFGMDPVAALRLAARWAREVPMETFEAYLEADRRVDLTDVLPSIHVPAFVRANQITDYAPAAVMASLLPDVRLSISEPAFASLDQLGRDCDDWDEHLGSRLGEPASRGAWRPGRVASGLLTKRESQVLRLLEDGCSNAEIAEALVLSRRTVEHHLSNIYSKLGVRTRIAAVNTGRENGLT